MIKVSNLSIVQAMQLINDGVEVYMPVLVEAPVSILEDYVYEGLPGRTLIDEFGEEFTVKIKDWGGKNNQPILMNRDKTRVIICCTINYEYLKGSEWIIFTNMEGCILHNNESYDLLKELPSWQEQ